MMTDFAQVHRQASDWPGAVAVVGLGQMGCQSHFVCWRRHFALRGVADANPRRRFSHPAGVAMS
jgi:hypothetical protein